MGCEEYLMQYWRQYIMLEREFAQSEFYVSIHQDNLATFSAAYIKLLLQIGSEVDIVAKQMCMLYDPKFNKRQIDEYGKCIQSGAPDFIATYVFAETYGMTLTPWSAWDLHSPYWWQAYNGNKHNRNETETINNVTKQNYQFANLQNTINALAGLFQLNLYVFEKLALAEGNVVSVPLPGSRLFSLKGGRWDQVPFYRDMVLHIKDGSLIAETGTINY